MAPMIKVAIRTDVIKALTWSRETGWRLSLGNEGELIIDGGSYFSEAEFINELLEACEDSQEGMRNDVLAEICSNYEMDLVPRDPAMRGDAVVEHRGSHWAVIAPNGRVVTRWTSAEKAFVHADQMNQENEKARTLAHYEGVAAEAQAANIGERAVDAAIEAGRASGVMR
jgi:hypothetical protein